jgi:hypothetical protein
MIIMVQGSTAFSPGHKAAETSCENGSASADVMMPSSIGVALSAMVLQVSMVHNISFQHSTP